MSPRVELRHSRSQVKKAGKLLRDHRTGSRLIEQSSLAEAVDILEQWRACHSYPLAKATMGLRTRVATEQCVHPEVSQRLKRRPTIVDKLVRQPNMQLTTMHDIGGCRAVLNDVDEVRRVERRWNRKQGRVVRTYDYLATPKASGYRGVHLVVDYDGFLIEVQLRTRLQHFWGTTIERVGAGLGADLKSSEGPDSALLIFKTLGDVLALSEGLPAPGLTRQTLTAAVEAAGPELLAQIGLEVSGDEILLHMDR